MHIGDGDDDDDDDDDDIHENSLWAYERTLPTITSTHARPQIKPTNNKVNGTRIDLFFFALRFNAEQFLIFIWTPLSLSPSLSPFSYQTVYGYLYWNFVQKTHDWIALNTTCRFRLNLIKCTNFFWINNKVIIFRNSPCSNSERETEYWEQICNNQNLKYELKRFMWLWNCNPHKSRYHKEKRQHFYYNSWLLIRICLL